MLLLLMEAGSETIIVNRDTCEYFFMSEDRWKNFHAEAIAASDWENGHAFVLPVEGERFTDNAADPSKQCVVGENVQQDDLLARFLDVKKNRGSMIAVRDSDSDKPAITDKRRYKKLLSTGPGIDLL